MFGRRATAPELVPGREVFFQRGNLPEFGRIVAGGDEICVPLMRVKNAGGQVSTRRKYWRNRSQLYVKRD